MAGSTTAARRYAEAALELARRDGTLDAWLVELRLAVELVGVKEAATVVDNPAIAWDHRRAIITGLLLLKKAGAPFLLRDPYVFSLKTWGALTLLHDVATLLTVFLILLHVYFGLLPEKRMYLRSMVSGWVTRKELSAHHDPERVARGE